MHADEQTCESHYEHNGPEKAQVANAVGKLGLYPLDEKGYAHALQEKSERYEMIVT